MISSLLKQIEQEYASDFDEIMAPCCEPFDEGVPARAGVGAERASPEGVSHQRKRKYPSSPEIKTTTQSSTPRVPSVSHRGGRKKPAAMPKRALSAYNLFFRDERKKLFQESQSVIGFEQLGKLIGQRWRSLSREERKKHELESRKDQLRYSKEMELFDEVRRKRYQPRDAGSVEQNSCSRTISQDDQSGSHDDSKQSAQSSIVDHQDCSAWSRSSYGGDFSGSLPSGGPIPTARLPPHHAGAVASMTTDGANPAYQFADFRSYSSTPTLSAYPIQHGLENNPVADPPFEMAMFTQPIATTRMLPSHASEYHAIPSGTEIVYGSVGDGHGHRYRITYNCYRMPMRDVEAMMQQLQQAATARSPLGGGPARKEEV